MAAVRDKITAARKIMAVLANQDTALLITDMTHRARPSMRTTAHAIQTGRKVSICRKTIVTINTSSITTMNTACVSRRAAISG